MPRFRALISNLYPLDVCSETVMMNSKHILSLFSLIWQMKWFRTLRSFLFLSSSLIPPLPSLIPTPTTPVADAAAANSLVKTDSTTAINTTSATASPITILNDDTARTLSPATSSSSSRHLAAPPRKTCISDHWHLCSGHENKSDWDVFCCRGVIEWEEEHLQHEVRDEQTKISIHSFWCTPPKLSIVSPLASTRQILAVETWQPSSSGWNQPGEEMVLRGRSVPSVYAQIYDTAAWAVSDSDDVSIHVDWLPGPWPNVSENYFKLMSLRLAHLNLCRLSSPTQMDLEHTRRILTIVRSFLTHHLLVIGYFPFGKMRKLIGIWIFVDMSSQSYRHIHFSPMLYPFITAKTGERTAENQDPQDQKDDRGEKTSEPPWC